MQLGSSFTGVAGLLSCSALKLRSGTVKAIREFLILFGGLEEKAAYFRHGFSFCHVTQLRGSLQIVRCALASRPGAWEIAYAYALHRTFLQPTSDPR